MVGLWLLLMQSCQRTLGLWLSGKVPQMTLLMNLIGDLFQAGTQEGPVLQAEGV